jgi:hypothetical protein
MNAWIKLLLALVALATAPVAWFVVIEVIRRTV